MTKKQVLNNELLGIIDQLKKNRSIQFYPYINEILTETHDELINNEFKITVVGEFSSGKSTFLNAIIGQDVLPHGLNETTATVTYIHNVPLDDSRLNNVCVRFREQSKPDYNLSLTNNPKALKDYVTTTAEKYNVAKEIASVELFLHFMDIDDPIVLIDTPGLNGVAEGHKEITLHEIKQSHASICLFHVRGMGDSDLHFIKELLKYQETVFFVLNAIDDIKLHEETIGDRMEAFKKDIAKYVYEDKQVPDLVYGISSLKALTSRDKTIPRLYSDDKADLCDEDRKHLLIESKFPELEKDLFQFFNNSEREKRFYSSICQRLEQVIDSFENITTNDLKIRQAASEDIPAKQNLVDRIKSVNDKDVTFKAKIKQTVTLKITDLQRELYEEVDKELNAELSSMNALIRNFTVEEAEQASRNNQLGKRLGTFCSAQATSLIDQIKKGIETIQKEIVLDLQKKLPALNFRNKKIDIGADIRFDLSEIATLTGRIDREKKELSEKEQQLRLCSTSSQSVPDIRADLHNKQREANDLFYQQQGELADLGRRPDVEYITKERIVEKEYSGFGGFFRKIWDSIPVLGSRYRTETYTIRDDSRQREYDRDWNDIKNYYNNLILRSKEQIADLERRLENAQKAESMNRILRDQIAKLREKIRKDEELREIQKKNSRTSYLRAMQKTFWDLVKKQLDVPGGELCISLKSDVRDNLEACKTPLLSNLYLMYEEKKKEYISNLQKLIDKIDQSEDSIQNRNQINLLSSDLSTLKNCRTNIINLIHGL
ncbi:MAG: dynamin family protein [Parabacteroides sp.]|nr:dynamin family protein [bacterium]MDY4102022.1 dynamin family protein [Parabacteroides sp.]